MTIEITNLRKAFGNFVAVKDVSLLAEEGSITALLGPSGSGKTTVLRMIAGLEVPDAGSIRIGGRDISHVAPRERNVGFVFQHYALFKHMKVGDNIAFPLKIRRWKRDATRERVAELLSLLRLEGLEKRYPDQISGGQRQRVALARALAAHPQVLLLDEPFSALDARVRDELREWLRELHEQLHVTSVFVTHDQSEAMELAERIVIMRDGDVVQSGSPEEIVQEPRSAFVMNFLGRVNILPGVANHGFADVLGVRLPYPAANGVSIPVHGHFRPQQVALSLEPTPTSLPVRVQRVITSGVTVKVQLATVQGDLPVVAEVDLLVKDRLGLAPGQPLHATPWNLKLFPVHEAVAAPPELERELV